MATKIYARVDTGIVVEIVVLDSTIDISTIYHPATVAAMFDVTNADPQPQVGWVYDNGVFSPPPGLSGQALKDDLKGYAGFVRYTIETAGIMVGGKPVATDRVSQSQITNAWTMVQNDPMTSVQWKDDDGNWTMIYGPQIVQMHEAVTTHVQLCFSTEADVDTKIDNNAITSHSQIDAIFAQIPHNPLPAPPSGGAQPPPPAGR